MQRFLLLAFLLVAPALRAQTPECALGDAESDLFVNDVRARLYNNGGLFWKGRGNVYNVPAAPTGKPITPNSIFAAGIWFGGKVDSGPRIGGAIKEIRAAAADYGNWELWPGPLGTDGAPPADCAPYDRIFPITRADVLAYERTGAVVPALRDWPWQWGAPVVDGDGVPDNYNLAGGDRPEVLGHEMHWWVMNDAANQHRSTGTKPLHMEVQASAFAVGSAIKPLHQATFYRYRLTYRGTKPLEDAYFGFWMDPDLGNATDDYVGSDTLLDMGFTYNGDDFDEGSDGYGQAPPALGTVFLKGLDEAHPDREMSVFLYYDGLTAANGDPRDNTTDWYNYLQGIWQDGKPILNCGDGYAPAPACAANARPTKFVWPGDPVTKQFWSEVNFDGAGQRNPPNDRHYLMTTGPFWMQPGEKKDVVIAIMWARGSDHLDSVTHLRSAARGIRAAWQADPTLSNVPVPAAPAAAPALPRATIARDSAAAVTFSWRQPGSLYRYDVEVKAAGVDTVLVTTGGEATLNLRPFVAAGRLLPGSAVRWRVRATTLGGAGPWTAWQQLVWGQAETPRNTNRFQILHAGPQPLRGLLRVRYAVGAAQTVRLVLYDALGRRVAVLHDGPQPPGGYYSAETDVSALAPGLYLLRLETTGPAFHTSTLPVVVVR